MQVTFLHPPKSGMQIGRPSNTPPRFASRMVEDNSYTRHYCSRTPYPATSVFRPDQRNCFCCGLVSLADQNIYISPPSTYRLIYHRHLEIPTAVNIVRTDNEKGAFIWTPSILGSLSVLKVLCRKKYLTKTVNFKI